MKVLPSPDVKRDVEASALSARAALLVREWSRLREEIARLEQEELDPRREREKRIREELGEIMGDLQSLKVPGVGTASFRETVYGVIRPHEDGTPRSIAEIKAALESVGAADVVQERVMSGALNAIVRSCVKEGKPLPEGIDFGVQRTLQFYPAKGSRNQKED